VRGRELHPVTVDEEVAVVGTENACDRLDERRLAGAVVADERYDLSGVHREIDAAEGDDAAEPLPHASQPEKRRDVSLAGGGEKRHRRRHWVPWVSGSGS